MGNKILNIDSGIFEIKSAETCVKTGRITVTLHVLEEINTTKWVFATRKSRSIGKYVGKYDGGKIRLDFNLIPVVYFEGDLLTIDIFDTPEEMEKFCIFIKD